MPRTICALSMVLALAAVSWAGGFWLELGNPAAKDAVGGELDRLLEIQQVSKRFQRHRPGHKARAQKDEAPVEALARPGVHAEDGALGIL